MTENRYRPALVVLSKEELESIDFASRRLYDLVSLLAGSEPGDLYRTHQKRLDELLRRSEQFTSRADVRWLIALTNQLED